MDLVRGLMNEKDKYTIENFDRSRMVDAKSIIGVMYMMMDEGDELFLVNETNNGYIPSFVDAYRPTGSEI